MRQKLAPLPFHHIKTKRKDADGAVKRRTSRKKAFTLKFRKLLPVQNFQYVVLESKTDGLTLLETGLTGVKSVYLNKNDFQKHATVIFTTLMLPPTVSLVEKFTKYTHKEWP